MDKSVTQKPLQVCVRNFWKEAFRNDFFEYVINRISPSGFELVEKNSDADVIFSSVFGSEPTEPHKTIFYTGENIRIDLRKAAYFLSFETDPWGGRNCYVPFWMLKVAWPGRPTVNPSADHYHATEPLIEIEKLSKPRIGGVYKGKTKFCAVIASNPESTRINLMGELSRYRVVDGFGPAFGRMDLRRKSEILADYRFVLCPENSFYPGYVTEKLMEGYLGGAIPIYFGAIPDGAGFNNRAFLNYGKILDTGQLLATIMALDTIPELYDRVYTEPLLVAEPKIDPVFMFLEKAINVIRER